MSVNRRDILGLLPAVIGAFEATASEVDVSTQAFAGEVDEVRLARSAEKQDVVESRIIVVAVPDNMSPPAAGNLIQSLAAFRTEHGIVEPFLVIPDSVSLTSVPVTTFINRPVDCPLS